MANGPKRPGTLVEAALQDRQLRAWSLAVSFLGDCIVPRGGIVGMSAMSLVLAGCGVDNGVVRTSISRLAGLHWVMREKVGRHSFYALTPHALAETQTAAARIYADRQAAVTCGWRMFWTNVPVDEAAPAADRRKVRADLVRLGAGLLGNHVYILPDTFAAPALPDVLTLIVEPAPCAQSRALVRQAFALADVAADYQQFVDVYAPILANLRAGEPISDVDALALRTLLIHDYRRIALRDPGIPLSYLPPGWPGIAAHATAAALWQRLFAGSEHWLGVNALGARGPLVARAIDAPHF